MGGWVGVQVISVQRAGSDRSTAPDFARLENAELVSVTLPKRTVKIKLLLRILGLLMDFE